MIAWNYEQHPTLSPSERKAIKEYFYPMRDGVWISPEEQADLVMEWGKLFLGDKTLDAHNHFSLPFSVFHKNLLTDLGREEKFYYVTCPSEFGKTSVVCLLYPLYRAYNKLDPFITVGGANQDLSKNAHLATIKNEIEANPKLIEVYGELKPTTKEIRDNVMLRWEAGFVILRNGVVIAALGAQGRIRGLKIGHRRPTLCLLDDIEDALSIKRSPKLPDTNYEWLRRDVMYRVDKHHGKVRLVGNMLGNNCTVARVQGNTEWKGIAYTVFDENGNSIWEEKFSTEYLRKERARAEENGELDIWLLERMNAVSHMRSNDLSGYVLYEGELTVIRGKTYLETNRYDKPIEVKQAIGVDPEKHTENSDPRAFMHVLKGWVYDNVADKWQLVSFFHDQLYKSFRVSDYVKQIAEWHYRNNVDAVAFEKNSLQTVFIENIEDYMRDDMFYRNNPFVLEPVENMLNKVSRILRMQYKFNSGHIWINSHLGYFLKEIGKFSRGISAGYHCLDAGEMAERICPAPQKPDLYEHLTNRVLMMSQAQPQSNGSLPAIGGMALNKMLGR